jgi:hypothetical protein
MAVTVLGVRHHGPGSARAVGSALDELAPDAVLVEGPPEAEAVVALAGEADMRPPVALLVYAPDEPRRAAFYPLAAFSPEWVAIRHAVAARIPVRFIDLPAVHGLADDETDDEAPHDPLALLAGAAGHDDPERWWEDVVEHREGALDVFAAVGEAMAALREDADDPGPREARREAAMRRAIRRTEKDGHERIAVICGAWHAPALHRDAFPPASHDDALLRGLPRAKVAATWVPWTHERLALASGYGAGVTSPGWYHHLFTAPDLPVTRWMQRVAALLRDEGLDASPASVVEAVRLADTLGAVRSRPRPGLSELGDAALAVLCQGNELPLGLIARKLVVGEVLGGVPAATPMVPLMEDLARRQRSLRMPAEAAARERELDLRKDIDLERSQLLHRLRLLRIGWGEPAHASSRSTGTFRETWRLEWQPELAVGLIEASRYGPTVETAAAACAIERAASSDDLPALTGLVEACLLAALPDAVTRVMGAVADRAATDADIGRLMDALEPLARVYRYGSVRRQDTSAVQAVVEGLVVRVAVGLAGAVSSLDDEAAGQMVHRIESVDGALALLDREDQRRAWRSALAAISDRQDVHARVTGRATRLLLDAGELDGGEARRRMELVLSRAAEADRGAAWLEGFLAGSGLLLLHDPALLATLDAWVAGVPDARFDDLLPILRRAFAGFATGERRQIGQAVRRLEGSGSAARPASADEPVDRARGDAAIATVLELLG